MKVPFPLRVVPALAWKAWFTPPPLGPKTRASDESIADDLKLIEIGGVAAYVVGSGPAVIALHGWGGRPEQLIPLARALASHGFRVVVPRLPGHAGGDRTDIKQTAAAVRVVADAIDEPVAIVAHSFASVVLRLAFPTVPPSKIVLLAPLMRVTHAVDTFSQRLRVAPWVRKSIRRRLEGWDPQIWPIVDGLGVGSLTGAEMLVLADPEDPETPFAAAAEFAVRREAAIVPVWGAGHAGILSAGLTIEAISGFLTATTGFRHVG